MQPQHQQILIDWSTGRLDAALKGATAWVDSSPLDVMPLLVLAETYLLRDDLQAVVATLQRAVDCDGKNHPMFYRMVFLGALKDKAFTAAHGALFNALMIGLPAYIVTDLKRELSMKGLMDQVGAYPSEENADPSWRLLLPRLWHRRTDHIPLVWAAYGGKFYLWNREFASLAARFASGASGDAWDEEPEAKRLAQRVNGDGIFDLPPQPAMLSFYQSVGVLAALHLFGYFPYPMANSVFQVLLPTGYVIQQAQLAPNFLMVENEATVRLIERLLPLAFEGRHTLTGPDDDLRCGLPWLLAASGQESAN